MTRISVVMVTMAVCALPVANAVAQAVPDGWVVLPVDEYRALRARAMPDPPPAAPPPIDAALSRIDYDLRPEGESVSGRAVLTVDVFREGWTRVQIPTGLKVRAARLADSPVPLSDGPTRSLLLSRPGRTVVSLDIVLPLTSSGGSESVVIPSSAAPVSRVTLNIAATGVDLAVAGGFLSERSESAGQSRWNVYGEPSQALTLSWKRRIDDRRTEQPLRLRARIDTTVGFGEEVALVSTSVHVEVLRGLAREFTLAVPEGLIVNQVNGPTVADWTASGTALNVRMLDPISDETSFVVQGETKIPREGTQTVPLIRIPAAERETGGVAADVVGAGEITAHQARGLEPADLSEIGDVPSSRESPSIVAFRLKPQPGAEPRSLNLTVVRYLPQAIPIANVEEARYRVLAAEDGRMLVEARYAVRNNQRSFVKITMPPGSVVWSAMVGGRTMRPGVAEQNAVLLPLEKGRALEDPPTIIVEVLYVQTIADWHEQPAARIDLPAIDLAISRSAVKLFYSPRFRVDIRPGTFRIEADESAFSQPLGGRYGAALTGGSRPGADDSRFRSLVDRFQKDLGYSVVTGTLPVAVTFPEWGPSLFLTSELAAESAAPSIDLALKSSR